MGHFDRQATVYVPLNADKKTSQSEKVKFHNKNYKKEDNTKKYHNLTSKVDNITHRNTTADINANKRNVNDK